MTLGVPAIDEQHEELFAQFGRLPGLISEGRGHGEAGKMLNILMTVPANISRMKKTLCRNTYNLDRKNIVCNTIN